MPSRTSFLDLPREVRDLIYDLTDWDVQSSSIEDKGTAYTPTSAPLLYVHPAITEDLQCRLYKDHNLVLPMQEPAKYVKREKTLNTSLEGITKMRQLRTKSISVEMSQTKIIFEEAKEGEEENAEPKEDYGFWYRDNENALSQLVKKALLDLKPSFPNVTTLKLIAWCAEWYITNGGWNEAIEELEENWKGISIEIQMYMFNYVDYDAGDGGSNFIQGWDDGYKGCKNITFTATNIENPVQESDEAYFGRVFHPEAWEWVNAELNDYEDIVVDMSEFDLADFGVEPGDEIDSEMRAEFKREYKESMRPSLYRYGKECRPLYVSVSTVET